MRSSPRESARRRPSGRHGAPQSESPALLSHAMGEQTFALTDKGHPALAVELVRAAQTQPAALSPLLRSWLRVAEAEACAAAGLDSECLRALHGADQLLPMNYAKPELPFLALDATHLVRWRGHCLARLGVPALVEEATRHLLRALAGMDGRRRR